MPITVASTLQKKDRGGIDHSKVLIVYDTADGTGTDSQYEIANTYHSAWELTLTPYGVDLSATNADSNASMWSLWMEDLADYVVANNVQAICAPYGFGSSRDGGNGQLFPIGVPPDSDDYEIRMSAVKTLGAIKGFKAIMDNNPSSTELVDELTNLQIFEKVSPTSLIYFDGLNLLSELQMQDSGTHFGGQDILLERDGETGTVGPNESVSSKYLGMREFASLSRNPNDMPVDEVTYSGVPFGTFIDPVLYPSPTDPEDAQKAAEIAESVFPVDDHPAVLAQDMFMPCWRIGWFKRSGNPTFTAQDCRDMVARSRATRKSLEWHKQQGNKVLMTAHRRASEIQYGVETYAPVTCMANDMGLETLVGYAERNPSDDTNTPELMDALATRTGLTQFASANVDYYENDQAADASGNTFVNVNGHKFFAQNGNTFPLDKVLFSYSTIAHNENNSVFGPLYQRGGANQIINLADGALGTETTSIGSAHACGFIQGGGCGFYGSVAEPFAEEDLNNGAGLFTKVLRGATYAEAAFGLNYNQLNLQELMGDGLAQPFADQATSNIMTTTSYKTPAGMARALSEEYRIGDAFLDAEGNGPSIYYPVLNAAGTEEFAFIGWMNRTVKAGRRAEILFSGTVSAWPSYLTLELVTARGTFTLDTAAIAAFGGGSWSTYTLNNGKTVSSVILNDTANIFPSLVDVCDTSLSGVDGYTLSAAFTGSATPNSGQSFPINTSIAGDLYEDGVDRYIYAFDVSGGSRNQATALGPMKLVSNTTDNLFFTNDNTPLFAGGTGTVSLPINSEIVVSEPVTFNIITNHPASGGGGSGGTNENILGESVLNGSI